MLSEFGANNLGKNKKSSTSITIMAMHSFSEAEKDRIDSYDMKRKKLYGMAAKAAFAIGALSLGLFIVLATGLFYGTSTGIQNNLITRLGIEIESEYAKEQTDPYVINAHIMQYFGSVDDMIQVNYFEHNEKTHLRDVKNLLDKARMLMLIFLAVGLIGIAKMYIFMRMAGATSRKGIMGVIKVLQYGSIAAMLLWIIIFISYIPLSSNAFDGAFTRMHEQLFPQGNWQFPEESLLIRTYPQEYFHSLGLAIVRYSMLTITILIVLSTLALVAMQDEKIMAKGK
jgi:uncharacterized membrane protein